MKIKDRDMIEKLLKLIIMENEGVTEEELGGLLDGLFDRKEVFPIFTAPGNNKVGTKTWHLETDQVKPLETLHVSIRKLMEDSNRITILLSPSCDQCEGMMSKFKSEGGIFSFRCDGCQITHEFKLVQESHVDKLEE